MEKWQEISISDIKNVRIGHADDEVNATGTTVLIFENGAACGLDVRGGGPASRESQLLNPTMSNQKIHGIVLSGGSAFGLDSAGGVMKYLEEKGIGQKVGKAIVPIVCASCIFDLNINDKVKPDAAMGYAACVDSEQNRVRNGCVGAGMGATVGKIRGDKSAMKSGLGCYAVQVGKLQVGAIVVVNAIGDVYEMDSNRQLAGLLNAKKDGLLDSELEAVKLLQLVSKFTFNTTIGAIVTNAKLDKTQMNKVAAMSSNGLARTIRPVNTSMDGDSIYAASCGNVKSSLDVVGTLGAYVLGKAVNQAVLCAESKFGYPSSKDILGGKKDEV